jgi:hypothetical protein
MACWHLRRSVVPGAAGGRVINIALGCRLITPEFFSILVVAAIVNHQCRDSYLPDTDVAMGGRD